MANRDNVNIVGHVDDVTNYVKDADIVVVPSVRPDPLPTIAIEAQCLGRAVMASNVGGLPEIVNPNETGWLLSAGDVDQWSHAIRTVTLEEASHFGAEASQLVRPAFSVQQFERAIHAELRGIRTGRWDKW
jgi:glycosyltransferase involved in cell wall biosynthesis